MNREQLHQLRNKEIDLYNLDELTNISDIKTDQSTTCDERIQKFMSEVKNPYILRCGDIAVKMHFSNSDMDIETLLSNFLIKQS